MKSIYLLFLISFLVFASCKKDKSEANSKDAEIVINELELIGKPIKEIEIHSSGIGNMVVVDTFLVILKLDEPLLQIYSTNTHRLLAEGGKKGEGPLEIMQPFLLNNTLKDKITNGPIIQVYDNQRRRINQFSVLNMINKQKPFNTPKALPDATSYYMNFNYNDDEKFIAAPEDGRFLIHKYSDSTDRLVSYIPKIDFEVKGLEQSFLYTSTLSINSDQKLMAAAPLLLGQLDFFDLGGNYIKSTVFEEAPDLQERLTSKSINPKHFIIEIEANQHWIYALNYNNYMRDLIKNENLQPMEFLVFDWDGKLNTRYQLKDNRSILSFAMDNNHNRIYGYCRDEEFYNIIVYDLDQ